MFLVKLIDCDRDSAPQAHPKYLGAREGPHLVFAIVRCSFGLSKTTKIDFFWLDLEGDDWVFSLLDQDSFHHQFDGCQAFCPITVFPITHTKKFTSIVPCNLNGSALAWLDFLGHTPTIKVFGFGFQSMDGHGCPL